MACFVPAKPPEVDASANPFSGMSMGAVSTIYTTRTMVRGPPGRAVDVSSHLNTLAGTFLKLTSFFDIVGRCHQFVPDVKVPSY